jgi:hypothetical protein
MKQNALLIICLFTSVASAAPPDLAAARARYDAAIASATNPIRERYIQDLQQLKSRAMTQKNLELAVAVDAELAEFAAPPTANAIRTATDLTRYLEGTLWTWGTSLSTAPSKLQFLKGGTCIINNDPPTRWTAEDGFTVSLSLGAKLKFSSDYNRYEGKVSSGEPRAGKRLTKPK